MRFVFVLRRPWIYCLLILMVVGEVEEESDRGKRGTQVEAAGGVVCEEEDGMRWQEREEKAGCLVA